MKKNTILALLATCIVACTKSPEDAAKEVCDCYKELGDVKVNELPSKAKKCTKMASDFSKEFKGEDLRIYSLRVANCAAGGLFN